MRAGQLYAARLLQDITFKIAQSFLHSMLSTMFHLGAVASNRASLIKQFH